MKTKKYIKKIKKLKKIKNETGQSMVELAVSLIVLLILLAGVVDVGRIAFYYIAMRDTAQEAASYASIFPNNNYEIIERAKAGTVDQSRITVVLRFLDEGVLTYECESADLVCSSYLDSSPINQVDVGDSVQITVTDSAFPITMPFIGIYLGRQSIQLETTVEDTVVRVPKIIP